MQLKSISCVCQVCGQKDQELISYKMGTRRKALHNLRKAFWGAKFKKCITWKMNKASSEI